jgi:hypothetical protein
MDVKKTQMAPQVLEHPGTRTTERGTTVDTKESTVFRPTEGSEDTHPHACTDGLVFLAYTVFDDEVGDEVERIEAVPGRRCAEQAKLGSGAYSAVVE